MAYISYAENQSLTRVARRLLFTKEEIQTHPFRTSGSRPTSDLTTFWSFQRHQAGQLFVRPETRQIWSRWFRPRSTEQHRNEGDSDSDARLQTEVDLERPRKLDGVAAAVKDQAEELVGSWKQVFTWTFCTNCSLQTELATEISIEFSK